MTLPTLPEESFRRVLCVVAHPDDMEYGTSAAVARWTARGIEVGYLLLTRGEAGMPNPPAETARLRAAEQQAACAVVGVEHLTVLEHPDGVLVYGLDLRRDICREIRRFKPDVVLGGGYDIETPYGFDQADHRAAGLATLDAVRDAGNRWVFPEQIDHEGLEQHSVRWYIVPALAGSATHGVEVTGESLRRGVASLKAHAAYLAALPDHPAPEDFIPHFTSISGKTMGVEHAVLFRAHDLQAPPGLASDDPQDADEEVPTNPSSSGHLPLNGLSIYYEVYGELDPRETSPLLLIPGGFMATDSMKWWVSAFAGTRTVIVFDQQGHGRTPDTSREMSYEQFADDAAALLRALQIEHADVLGYSQGGGVAIQLALRHPNLVSKLVSLAATYRADGWYPSVIEDIRGLNAAAFAGTSVEKAFKQHTPDPAAFDAYLQKMKRLAINDQNISDAQMRSISAKTMIIAGDTDAVKPEHALAMFTLRGGGDEEAAAPGTLQRIPAARLVILPATSHIGIFGQSTVLAPMVNAFLDDVLPTTPKLF
nr:alpha/beta fold hydrolase [Nocardia miyunensis]